MTFFSSLENFETKQGISSPLISIISPIKLNFLRTSSALDFNPEFFGIMNTTRTIVHHFDPPKIIPEKQAEAGNRTQVPRATVLYSTTELHPPYLYLHLIKTGFNI